MNTQCKKVRRALVPLSWLYALGVILHRLLYSAGVVKIYRPAVRTVSVGNITAGGTGKSPLVELLAAELSREGRRTTVIRRDSAGPGADLSDEEKVFAENVPGIRQICGRDKACCAKRAGASKPDIIIIDDGFQTVSLARDLDIVMIDAASPFGGGHLLPAGYLREPAYALRRADVVVLSRCEEITERNKKVIVETIRRWTSADVFEARYAADELKVVGSDGTEDVSVLKGKSVLAFCGIGNPEGFFATLERLGCSVEGKLVFRDHYVYEPNDIRRIEKEAELNNCDVIVTTQKDAVKLLCLADTERKIYYLKVKLDILEKERLVKRVLGMEGE